MTLSKKILFGLEAVLLGFGLTCAPVKKSIRTLPEDGKLILHREPPFASLEEDQKIIKETLDKLDYAYDLKVNVYLAPGSRGEAIHYANPLIGFIAESGKIREVIFRECGIPPQALFPGEKDCYQSAVEVYLRKKE